MSSKNCLPESLRFARRFGNLGQQKKPTASVSLAAGFPVLTVVLLRWQVEAHQDPSPDWRKTGRSRLAPARRGFLEVRGLCSVPIGMVFSHAGLGCVVLAFFHFVAGLKELHQTVDQFLPAPNHMQAVFALMLIQQPGETLFEFHVSTLPSLLSL